MKREKREKKKEINKSHEKKGRHEKERRNALPSKIVIGLPVEDKDKMAHTSNEAGNSSRIALSTPSPLRTSDPHQRI